MIIPYNFADDLLDKIDDLIFSHYENDEINFKEGVRPSSILDYEALIKSQAYSFPVGTMGATDLLLVTRYYYDVLVRAICKEDPNFMRGSHEETVNETVELSYLEETMQSAIREKVSNLVFKYDKVLEATKETNYLFGIEDEEKILQIHLKKYLEVLNSDVMQIHFVEGLVFSKEISDLILEIYIRFIGLRLEMLNPVVPFVSPDQRGKVKRIVWNGTQKELLELFIELQDKGWINEFENGEKSKIANSICNLFDLTHTKRKAGSDVENSFYQILKGHWNRDTNKHDYSGVLPLKGKRKFEKIKKM